MNFSRPAAWCQLCDELFLFGVDSRHYAMYALDWCRI